MPDAETRSSLLVVGAIADVVEDQFRDLFADLGIDKVEFLPSRNARQLPEVGENTAYLLAQPFLTDTAMALDERGAKHLPAEFPIGENGTTEWLRAAAKAFGVSDERFDAVTQPKRERARYALEKYREALNGKKVFFFPDSQLEIPLARFLAEEVGMQLTEIGTPYLHREHLAAELDRLPDDVLISEGQNVENQIDRCWEAKPDIVVCGLGLANPFEAEGMTTKWSIELLFSPIHGYEQAADCAELFARPLRRRGALRI
jgi:light-independent protochlorophyllide reductase subunit N